MQNEDRFRALLGLVVVITAVVLVIIVVVYYVVYCAARWIQRLVQRRVADTPKVSTSLDSEVITIEYKGVEMMAEKPSTTGAPAPKPPAHPILTFARFCNELRQKASFTDLEIEALYGVYLDAHLDQVLLRDAYKATGSQEGEGEP